MAKVKFTADFDYKPTPQIIVGYVAGMEDTVRRECADQAIAAGKAVAVKRIRRAPDGETKSGG